MRRRAAGWARRHWLGLLVTVVLTALTVNAWRDAGAFVMAMLAVAAVGLAVVAAGVWWTSGAAVVHHSRQQERAIEAAHGPKQVSR